MSKVVCKMKNKLPCIGSNALSRKSNTIYPFAYKIA